MSREELVNFINAAEHSLTIKKELSRANHIEDIVYIAKKYGFKIRALDIKEADLIDTQDRWFKESKISALKRIN